MTNHTIPTSPETLTSRDAERLLAAEVAAVILSSSADEHLHWTGTAIDLMEALYTAYLTYTLRDDQGNCLSFRQIVSRACAVLHMPVPHNPYEVACRARRRKGLKCLPFLDRYLWQKQHHPHTQPFLRLVAVAETASLRP